MSLITDHIQQEIHRLKASLNELTEHHDDHADRIMKLITLLFDQCIETCNWDIGSIPVHFEQTKEVLFHGGYAISATKTTCTNGNVVYKARFTLGDNAILQLCSADLYNHINNGTVTFRMIVPDRVVNKIDDDLADEDDDDLAEILF
jgi:hypothetical protein